MGKIRKFKTGATRDINWKWLGGFFDGEGYACFCGCNSYMYYRKRKDGSRKIVPYKSSPRLGASIAQKELYILKKIKKFLGYGHIRKKGGYWACNSANARKFLKNILPYIRTKHKKTQVIKVLKKDNRIVKPRRRNK